MHTHLIDTTTFLTVNTFAPLIAGIVFLIIGIITCFYFRWKKLKGYIPLLIGLFLIYITTIGPLSRSRNKVNQLTKIEFDQVKAIVLQPTKHSGSETISLFYRDSTIVDKNKIKSLCQALNKAVIANDDFLKSPQSRCRIEILMSDKSIISFGVKKKDEATCLIIDSDSEYGWHYANLQANEFGALLNQFTNR